MNIERYLRLVAGVVVLGSLALAHWVNPWFFALTAFAGANLLQSGITNWCPLVWVLRRLRVPACGEAARREVT